MKKYWKTILISLVIVTTISSYYIQAAIASKNPVSFKIETTSGNKEEIENLILQASVDSNNFYRSLYISKDGSTDRIGQSLIGGLISSYEPFFQKYIEEHRSFMRGKELYLGNYFEDESRLIYANFSHIGRKVIEGNPLTFKIDILDKSTNDNSSFEINTPAQASYSWISVSDVYAENGEIKIFVTGYIINGGEELHIYTVDETSKELKHKKMIAKVEPEEEVSSRIHIFNDLHEIQNDNYYLYNLIKYTHQTENADSKMISRQTYLYNNSTNEVEGWEVPAELAPYMDLMVVHGKDLFIPVSSDTSLELNRYNIEKEQWEEPLNFNYPSTANTEDEPFIKITDGKLYLVNRASEGHVLFIGDLRTGESLYEGRIISENRENLDKDNSLYVEQLYILK